MRKKQKHECIPVGMHTARLLTMAQHALRRVCVYPSIHRSCGGVYPSMHWVGGVSQHALGRGGSVQGEGTVCIPACNGEDTPSPVDRQTPVKT